MLIVAVIGVLISVTTVILLLTDMLKRWRKHRTVDVIADLLFVAGFSCCAAAAFDTIITLVQ